MLFGAEEITIFQIIQPTTALAQKKRCVEGTERQNYVNYRGADIDMLNGFITLDS